MVRKIAIDAGKGFTKMAIVRRDKETGGERVQVDKFPSKMTENADMNDYIAGQSFTITYNGKTYVIGESGKNPTEREVSKKSELHKIATITAIASLVDNGDEVWAVVGIPVSLASNAQAREDYKNYILPLGKHEVIIKKAGTKEVKKEFYITKNGVALEGIGVAMIHSEIFSENLVGIVDLGNLNKNSFLINNFVPVSDSFNTDNKGFRYLLQNMTTDLSGKLSMNISETEVAQKLRGPIEKRFLFNKEVENSKEISKRLFEQNIHDYLKETTDSIKNRWNMGNTDTVFVGGTSILLKNEIIEFCENEFGQAPIIFDDADYTNVKGFLKMLG